MDIAELKATWRCWQKRLPHINARGARCAAGSSNAVEPARGASGFRPGIGRGSQADGENLRAVPAVATRGCASGYTMPAPDPRFVMLERSRDERLSAPDGQRVPIAG